MALSCVFLSFHLVYSFHCPTFLFSSAVFGFLPFRKHVRLAHNVINYNTSFPWQRLTTVLLLGVAQQTAAVS